MGATSDSYSNERDIYFNWKWQPSLEQFPGLKAEGGGRGTRFPKNLIPFTVESIHIHERDNGDSST